MSTQGVAFYKKYLYNIIDRCTSKRYRKIPTITKRYNSDTTVLSINNNIKIN